MTNVTAKLWKMAQKTGTSGKPITRAIDDGTGLNGIATQHAAAAVSSTMDSSRSLDRAML